MSDINDFVIENGMLKKYTGSLLDVVIPDGVSVIGEKVFASKGIPVDTIGVIGGYTLIVR